MAVDKYALGEHAGSIGRGVLHGAKVGAGVAAVGAGIGIGIANYIPYAVGKKVYNHFSDAIDETTVNLQRALIRGLAMSPFEADASGVMPGRMIPRLNKSREAGRGMEM